MAGKRHESKTIGEALHWLYAGLAMYEYAQSRGLGSYDKVSYAIRSRIYKQLQGGAMSPRSIYREERIKLVNARQCAYCGQTGQLTLDHLFPRKRGGSDSGDNLVYSCQSCNSSKGDKDLFTWLRETSRPIPVDVVRRYLKNAIAIARGNNLLDAPIENAKTLDLPFDVDSLPTRFELDDSFD